MSKLFTVAGTSVLDGVLKFRTANGGADARARVLAKNGHTEINLQDLPKPMTKEDAQAFLGYVEGTAVKVAKKVKLEVPKGAKGNFKTTKTKEVKVDALVKRAPKVDTAGKTPEEVAEIRAKNLQTLREVGAKFRAEQEEIRRAEAERMLEQANAEIDSWAPDFEVPKFLRKELGIEA